MKNYEDIQITNPKIFKIVLKLEQLIPIYLPLQHHEFEKPHQEAQTLQSTVCFFFIGSKAFVHLILTHLKLYA